MRLPPRVQVHDISPHLIITLRGTLRGLRRLTTRPPEVSLTLPGRRRPIEFAKLLACAAISTLEAGDLTDREPVTVKAVADEALPRKMVRVDGFVNEDLVPEGVGINALVSPETSDLGGGNVLYSTRVELERPKESS